MWHVSHTTKHKSRENNPLFFDCDQPWCHNCHLPSIECYRATVHQAAQEIPPRRASGAPHSFIFQCICLITREQPRHGFLREIQEGNITALQRAETLAWLHELAEFHDCESDGFVLAVDLCDRLLSVTKVSLHYPRNINLVHRCIADEGKVSSSCVSCLFDDCLQVCDGGGGL
jgi:hypothetical protein